LNDLNKESEKEENAKIQTKSFNNYQNIEENINENNNFITNSNVSINHISKNEKTATSKFTQLNNSEDYVRGKNISGITNEVLNQIDANDAINENKLNKGILFQIYF
jgi:hypothetical protein